MTLLEEWAWENFVVTQPVGYADRAVDLPIVYSYRDGLHYEEKEDVDY